MKRFGSKRWTCAAVITLGACVAALPAAAQGPAAPAVAGSADSAAPAGSAAPAPPSLSDSLTGNAKERYEAGKVLYRDGDYAGAMLKFQEAFDTSKDARLLWNIAACEKNLRHYARVQLLLDRYLAEGGPLLTEQDKVDAQRLMDTIQEFIGRVTLTVSEPGATVWVDGVAMGTTPLQGPLLLDMGPREIRVTKDGFDDFVQRGGISGGSATTLTVTLNKAVRQGTLQVLAGPNDTITVDGKAVGVGQWQGNLAPGPHRVQVSAEGMQPYDTQAVVELKQRATVRVKLSPIPTGPAPAAGSNEWLWITSGVALAVGIGVGGYLLLRPKDEEAPPPVAGTIPPGTVQLPLWR